MINETEKCPVCSFAIILCPYYVTKHGKVCEDCYESRKNEESEYDKFLNKRRTE